MDRFKRGLDAYKKVVGTPSSPASSPNDAPAASEAPKPPSARPAPSRPSPSGAASPVVSSPSSSEKAVENKSLLKTQKDNSLRKVAKFLILLGKDEAAKVVRYLEPSQIEALGREIAGIRKIEPVEAQHILKEFGYIAKTIAAPLKGGKDAAAAILSQAFGEQKSKVILKKSVPSAPPFEFLKDVDRTVLKDLLADESVLVLSIVVPHLDKAQAATFLGHLGAEVRVELVKRLAKMQKVSKETVERVENGIREKLHALAPATYDAVDGKSKLAEILRHMNGGKEETILRALDDRHPELTKDLRERLFTETQLLQIFDADWEDLLRQKTDEQLALLWLAMGDDLRRKTERNLTSRRMLLVQAEVDLLSKAPRHEIQAQMKLFLDEVRQRVREGSVSLIDGNEEYL